MSKLIISGGTLVDGTGAPAVRADVHIVDDQVVAVASPGTAGPVGADVIDASGLVVAPGFIDLHTHLDAQVFWDAALSPVPLHGVTTVISGNCGFSVAPLTGADDDYLVRMLARVEGMPLNALQHGVPWDWTGFGSYLERVEQRRPAVHMGFMVGHSALRRAVLGGAAHGDASAEQIEAMCELLDKALAAGGLGLSTSWSRNHVDGSGDPVPSRLASAAEALALAEVVGRYPATQLQVSPSPGFGDDEAELMRLMSLRAKRPINWNVYVPRASQAEAGERMLGASDTAARTGARIWALAYPDVIRARYTLDRPSVILDGLSGWSKLSSLPLAEKARILGDPRRRSELAAAAAVNGPDYWDDTVVLEGAGPRSKAAEGRRLADLAQERGDGSSAFDLLCELAVADELRTAFTPPAPGDDEATWKIRTRSWNDPRVVLGASDAGAHLDLITTYDWAPALFAANRDRGVLTLEQAVHKVTAAQADAYGLIGRGRLRAGAVADVVVFDPDTIAPGRTGWRDDLPAGAGRLYQEPAGIAHVIAAGTEVARDGRMTGKAGGRVLRAGRDTRPVAPLD
jgi:N-acyl-D-aspartate/D-glutamate deacylase